MLRLRFFSAESFIILVAVLMMVTRVVYLQIFDAVNEIKFGDFNFEEHFLSLIHFYLLAFLYIVIQIKSCVDFTYKNISRLNKDISFVYLATSFFLLVKFLYPDQYYIDMIVPVFYIIYVGISDAVIKKHNTNLLFWCLILTLVGSLNESKAAALRLLFIIPAIYLLHHPVTALKINTSPRVLAGLALITGVTVYFVAVRSGVQISVAGINELSSFAADIISQRFNIIDGSIAISGIPGIDIDYMSFLMNHFVLLPGVEPSGQTLAQFVACEVDLNCTGTHAGAVGLPMMLKLLPAHYVISSFLVTTVAYHITRMLLVNLGLGIHWLVAFDGTFLLTILNLFVSGNFDVCISEFMVLCASIFGFAMLHLVFSQFVFRVRNAH